MAPVALSLDYKLKFDGARGVVPCSGAIAANPAFGQSASSRITRAPVPPPALPHPTMPSKVPAGTGAPKVNSSGRARSLFIALKLNPRLYARRLDLRSCRPAALPEEGSGYVQRQSKGTTAVIPAHLYPSPCFDLR